MSQDSIKWDAGLLIRRWDADQTAFAQKKLGLAAPQEADFDKLRIKPHEGVVPEFGGVPGVTVIEPPANLLTTAGIGRIATLLNAGTGNLISSTTARVGVGDGAGTAAIGDTDLSASAGSTHRWFNLCTVTIPSNVLTFASSFASADGNFAWNEWGVDIGTATVTAGNTVNAVLLNHKTSISQGTKASGQTWSVTATITLS